MRTLDHTRADDLCFAGFHAFVGERCRDCGALNEKLSPSGIVATARPSTDDSPEVAAFYWPLFSHLAEAHKLTLLDSELEEIRRICVTMGKPFEGAAI